MGAIAASGTNSPECPGRGLKIHPKFHGPCPAQCPIVEPDNSARRLELTQRKAPRRGLRRLTTLFAIILLSACVAPDARYLMELNRSGKWKEAERIGLDMLSHRLTFSDAELCEITYSAAYAATRLHETKTALRLLQDFDELRARTDPGAERPWLDREVASLKSELGLLGKAQSLLLEALQANAKGDYRGAARLCEEALASPEAGPAQRAVAHFLMSITALRQGDLAKATQELAAYEADRGALPPGHQALREEATLRADLAKAAKP